MRICMRIWMWCQKWASYLHNNPQSLLRKNIRNFHPACICTLMRNGHAMHQYTKFTSWKMWCFPEVEFEKPFLHTCIHTLIIHSHFHNDCDFSSDESIVSSTDIYENESSISFDTIHYTVFLQTCPPAQVWLGSSWLHSFMLSHFCKRVHVTFNSQYVWFVSGEKKVK